MADGVQQMLGDAGACPEIQWNGKVWRIGHPTQRAKAALEELAAAKAVTEVTALRAALPPAVYAELFDGVLKDVASGAYRTFGPGWVRQTTGPAGPALFLLSLLRERHPEATEADAIGLAAAKGDELKAALARVVPGFFDLALESHPAPPEAKALIRGQIAAAMLAAFSGPTDSPPPASS